MSDSIRLSHDELYDPKVDEIIARQEALVRGAGEHAAPPRWRTIVYSSMFFLSIAGTLGGLIGWAVLEPMINETVTVGGVIETIGLPNDLETNDLQLRVKGLRVLLDEEVTRVGGSDEEGGAVSSLGQLQAGQQVRIEGMIVPEAPDTLLANRIVVTRLGQDELEAPPPDLARLQALEMVSGVFTFAIIGAGIAGFLAAADGLISRNLRRGLLSALCGVGIAAVGGIVGLVPAGMVLGLAITLVEQFATGMWTSDSLSGLPMVFLVVGRSLTWGILGLTVGLGQGAALRSKNLLLNGLLGGMMGGLVGGALFDPISKLLADTTFSGQAVVSRALGFTTIGLSAGLMIGLVERVAKQAWLQMKAGPLAGKEFVIYKSPMSLGSSPKCDVYLFKDAEVEPQHALLQLSGTQHEIVDLGARAGVWVNGVRVGRAQLSSGDQLVIGSTVLEYAQRETGMPTK